MALQKRSVVESAAPNCGGKSQMNGHLLLVDDDPAVLSSLRRALVLEGYEVAVAEDGETALALAVSQPPDLMVLDVMLPGLDGMAVCERLRASSATPRIPCPTG
jgi:two-component system response regulator MprA